MRGGDSATGTPRRGSCTEETAMTMRTTTAIAQSSQDVSGIHGKGRIKKDPMKTRKQVDEQIAQILEMLRQQYPGRVTLSRTETAHVCGYKNAITVDRLAKRELLHPSRATRIPKYPLPEVARFLAETSVTTS
jgi:hypothetical protein